MVDLTNAVYTYVKKAVLSVCPAALVVKPFQNQSTQFPYVTVQNVDFPEIEHTLDYGERKYSFTCQIEIYTKGGTAETTAMKIRSTVADSLENDLHMKCEFSGTMQNVSDTTIYRYVMRYSCKYDAERNKIYS